MLFNSSFVTHQAKTLGELLCIFISSSVYQFTVKSLALRPRAWQIFMVRYLDGNGYSDLIIHRLQSSFDKTGN
jgi:hypothetical protein